MNEYLRSDFRFSYFNSGSGVEINLIVDRPGQRTLLIEIKSTTRVDSSDLQRIQKLCSQWPVPAEALLLSLDSHPQVVSNDVQALIWFEGLKKAFALP